MIKNICETCKKEFEMKFYDEEDSDDVATAAKRKDCPSCVIEKHVLTKSPEKCLPDSVPINLVKNITPLSTCSFIESKIVKNGEQNQGFYLFGKTGVGKSQQAAIWLYLNLRYELKYDGAWFNVPQMLFEIRQSYQSRSNREQEIFNECTKSKWLCLDDLGIEKTSDFSLQVIYLIINHRYENSKPTFITSNLSIQELSKKMDDDRLTSRIAGMCREIEIKGNDKRKRVRTKWNNK